jgi:hypothetical protein
MRKQPTRGPYPERIPKLALILSGKTTHSLKILAIQHPKTAPAQKPQRENHLAKPPKTFLEMDNA